MRVVLANEPGSASMHQLMHRLQIALVLSFLLILPACAAIPVTRPVIKIGLAAPFQGEYRYVGYEAIFGARLALREVNAAEGVAGYNVELVAYDDEGTPAGARHVAQNLALDSQVVTVIGHFHDQTTATARQIYAQAGLPLLSAGTVEGGPDNQTRARLFCPLLDYLAQATTSSRAPADGSPVSGKVQWIPSDLLSSKTIEELVQVCDPAVSLEISAQLPPSPDTLAVILPVDPLEAGAVARRLGAMSWTGYLAGGPGLGSPLFSQIAGPVEVVFASLLRWPDVKGQDAEFRAAYQALGPHVPEPGPFALGTYRAVQKVLAAVGMVGQGGDAVARPNLKQVIPTSSPDTAYLYRRSAEGELELISRQGATLRGPGVASAD
jgi:ABC-type branched-subunit amino acid transport system substrate-binding protein